MKKTPSDHKSKEASLTTDPKDSISPKAGDSFIKYFNLISAIFVSSEQYHGWEEKGNRESITSLTQSKASGKLEIITVFPSDFFHMKPNALPKHSKLRTLILHNFFPIFTEGQISSWTFM